MLDAEPWMRVLAALVAAGMLAAFLVRAIRKDPIRIFGKFFDAAKNIIPTTCVKPSRVFF